jgi:hypothetical protein
VQELKGRRKREGEKKRWRKREILNGGEKDNINRKRDRERKKRQIETERERKYINSH